MPKKKAASQAIKVPSWIYEEVVAVSGSIQAARREQVSMSWPIEIAWKIATGLSVSSDDAQEFARAVAAVRATPSKQTKAG